MTVQRFRIDRTSYSKPIRTLKLRSECLANSNFTLRPQKLSNKGPINVILTDSIIIYYFKLAIFSRRDSWISHAYMEKFAVARRRSSQKEKRPFQPATNVMLTAFSALLAFSTSPQQYSTSWRMKWNWEPTQLDPAQVFLQIYINFRFIIWTAGDGIENSHN